MLNCPFCNSEYDTDRILDGRCPNCGGIVNWSSDEVEESSASPMVTVSLGPSFLGNRPNRQIVNLKQPVVDPDKPVEIASNTVSEEANTLAQRATVEPRELEPAIQDKDTDSQYRKTLSTDVIDKLGGIWERAAMQTTSPTTTIQTSVEESSQPIEVVINERRFNEQLDVPQRGMDYQVLKQIGKGAVGVVYAAQQNSISRNVAVKMLNADSAVDEHHKEKFLFEAVVTGDLDHPNIVPIHELGKNQNGDLFYSMKQVVGTPWSGLIGSKSLSENLEVLLKVCDAVSFAHSRGIVHRDLKPENTMLGEYGEVLVVDWGIALPVRGFSKSADWLPKPGIAGTPAYMAPEMATGPLSKIGAHSDVYLLGAMLFEVVTKLPPHRGKSVMECVIAAADNSITPTEETGELIDIAYRAMATEPEDRYSSVAEFKSALYGYQSHIESISLTERAQSGYDKAIKTDNYQDYSRAAFAFQEALDLWDGNVVAKAGLRQANLSYAKCALAKSDFELGLSLVDSADPKFEPIQKSLTAGLKARNKRQARIKSLAFTLIIAGISFALFMNYQKNRADKAAITADGLKRVALKDRQKAELNKLEAQNSQQESELEKRKAEESEFRAKQDRVMAVNERKNAENAKRGAEFAQRKEVEMNLDLAVESYFSEIGAITEKISQKAFPRAREIIANGAQLAVRHWEWGRLNEVCNGINRKSYAASYPIHSVAIHDSRQENARGKAWFAVAGSNGRVEFFPGDPFTVKPLTLDFENDEGMQGVVNVLAFSPDGNQLLAAGAINDNIEDKDKGYLAVWDVSDGEKWDSQSKPEMFELHEDAAITCLDFSPDQKLLLTGSEDKTLRLWDYPIEASGENKPAPRKTFVGHKSEVWDCDFDPNSDSVHYKFVSGSQDASVRIWDDTRNEAVGQFREHVKPVYQVEFSSNGTQVATAGMDGKILLWNIEESAYSDNNDLKSAIAKRLNQEGLSTISKDNRESKPLAPSQRVGQHSDSVRVLEFSPNGEFLLSAGDDNVINLWSLASPKSSGGAETESTVPKLVRSFLGHGSPVRGAVFAGVNLPPNAKWPDCPSQIYSGGTDHNIFQWEINELPPTIQKLGVDELPNTDHFQFKNAVNTSAVSPGSQRLLIAGAKEVEIWKLPTGESPAMEKLSTLSEGHDYLCSRAVVVGDGSKMLTAGGDDSVILWNVKDRVQLRRWKETGRRGLLSIAKIDGGNSGGYIFATCTTKDIKVFYLDGRNLSNPIQPKPNSPTDDGFFFSAVALSENGEFLIAGDSYGRCFIWRQIENDSQSLIDWQLIQEWKGHSKPVVDVHFLPDNPQDPGAVTFVTAGTEGAVIKWSLINETNDALDADLRPSFPVAGGTRLVSTTLMPMSDFSLTRMLVKQDGSAALVVLQESTYEPSNNGAQPEKGPPNVHLKLIHTLTNQQSNQGAVLPFAKIDGARVSAATFDSQKPDNIYLAVQKITKETQATTSIFQWQTGLKNSKPLSYITKSKNKSPVGQIIKSLNGEFILASGKGVEFLTDQPDQRDALEVTGKLRSQTNINSIAYSPNGDWILTGDEGGSAKIWNAKTYNPVFKVEVGGSVAAVKFARHSNNAVVATQEGNVYRIVYDDDGKQTWTKTDYTQPSGHEEINDLCFSPDDRFLLTAGMAKGQKGLVCVREFQTGKQVAVLPHAKGKAVLCVTFSANGQLLLTGCADNNAYLWKTKDGSEIDWQQNKWPIEFSGILSGHQEDVVSVDFSRDRIRALTASNDGTAKLWDLQTNILQDRNDPDVTPDKDNVAKDVREIMTLSKNEVGLVSARFVNCGRDILTTCQNGQVVIFRASPVKAAISWSKLYLGLDTNSDGQILDDQTLLLCPVECDFEASRLVIEIDSDSHEPRGTLGFSEAALNASQVSEVDDKLFFTPFGDGEVEKVQFGSVENESNSKITINFTKDATADAIEQLIRTINYQFDSNGPGQTDLSERVKLTFLNQSAGIDVFAEARTNSPEAEINQDIDDNFEILFSKRNLFAKNPLETESVDEKARVFCPLDYSFEGCALVVEATPKAGKVDFSNAALKNAKGVVFGSIEDEPNSKITINFTNDATADAIEKLIHTITYERNPDYSGKKNWSEEDATITFKMINRNETDATKIDENHEKKIKVYFGNQ